MRLSILFVFMIMPLANLVAQVADTVVRAEGKILNGETKEPITAKITYESVPYGSRIGVINNSSYSFPMFDNERYSITVEAPGFAAAKFMLDPAEANTDNIVLKDIELTLPKTTEYNLHEVGQVMRLTNLIFEQSRSRIDPESYSELDLVVNMMKRNASMMIQLEGHTDYLGDPKQNIKLSEQRVDAVKEYLVSKGISKKRIRTVAFGGTQPLSRDNTPEGHRLNRRVELRILRK
jgi:OmpA-OmpF porin, OOP family